jgi:Right handed beta helix region/Protein of unknown function (DUF1565)
MRNRRLFFVVCTIAALNPAVATAGTLHVAPSGDDGNPGTTHSPIRTIQKAAELARAGDTVLVHAGVYKGLVLLRFSGDPERPITFKNAPDEKPILDGERRGRIEMQAEDGWRKPIGWVTVAGFEVRNGWDGIKFYNAHHIVLKGNFIHDNDNQGILGNGHHVRIEGNVIAHNGFKADNERSNKEHGIYATGTDFEIINNVICSNRAYGIQVAAYPFKADSHAGPEFASARRWHIAHNTITFQQNRAGIVVWQPEATDCLIENNIFFRNAVTLGGGDCQGIDFATAGDRHIIRNNLFFGPGRTAIQGNSGGYTATANLEDKDPLFEDAERGDFYLRDGSLAIDSAGAQSAVSADIEGIPRPQGKTRDIGAFEYRKKEQ